MDSLKENLGSSTCPALWRVETEHPCKAEVADMETDIGHIASWENATGKDFQFWNDYILT